MKQEAIRGFFFFFEIAEAYTATYCAGVYGLHCLPTLCPTPQQPVSHPIPPP